MLTNVVGYQHAGSGWLLQFYLPWGRHEIFNIEDQWTSVWCLQGLWVTCRAEQWAVDMFTPRTTAPWSADDKKLGRFGNEAKVRVSGTIRACSARAAICRVGQCAQSTSHFYTLKHVVRLHLCMQRVRHDVDTYTEFKCVGNYSAPTVKSTSHLNQEYVSVLCLIWVWWLGTLVSFL